MKTVVAVNDVSELDIRPDAVLSAWKTLVAQDMEQRWKNSAAWTDLNCPVCDGVSHTHAFEKNNFRYVTCNQCQTLFASHRPHAAELQWWYTASAASRYWREELLKHSAASRDEKIIEPRAYWILDGIAEYLPAKTGKELIYTDLSFFGKALNEKIRVLLPDVSVTAAGITVPVEQYTVSSIRQAPVSDLHSLNGIPSSDVIVAIDVLERIPSIQHFLQQLETMIKPGGLLFATCPVSSGFEIQSLWEMAPSITQPDKLNLPTWQGLLDLIRSSGKWKVMELSTPGMFDIDSVQRTLQQHPGKEWPRVLHALTDQMDTTGKEAFTTYLQSQKKTSFARLVLKRES